MIYIKARNKYCYRFILVFESGDIRTVQVGGFTNKQKARAAKEQAIVQISKGNFVPYSYTVREFYDYWLYHYMIEEKQMAYNTFTTYKSILNSYLFPALRHKKLSGLQRKDLLRVLSRISSQSVQRTAAGVISGSLRLAQARGYISTNIYQGIAAEVKRKNLQKKRKKETSAPKTQVYTVKQAAHILYMCKQTEPQIYLPMLLAVTAGLRLSEIQIGTPNVLARLYVEIVSHYLIPTIGKYLLNNIKKEELEGILGEIWSDDEFDSACIVLIKSFETALEYHCIDENVALPAVSTARNRRMLARLQIPSEKKKNRNQIKESPKIPVGKIYENPFDDDYLLELME